MRQQSPCPTSAKTTLHEGLLMTEKTSSPIAAASMSDTIFSIVFLIKHGGSMKRKTARLKVIRKALLKWTGAPLFSLTILPMVTTFIKALRHNSNGIDRYSDQNGRIRHINAHGTKQVQTIPAMKEADIWIKR